MHAANTPKRRWQGSPRILLALGLVSGAVALAYEVLWTRELLNLLGSTTRASALVLAGFLGGMALGAYAAGRWTTRLRRPLRLYAAAEGALGALGIVFSHALNATAGRIGSNVMLDAALLALLVVPALLAGATLPALAAALQGQGAERPKHVAMLYGLHALGGAAAALGVGLIVLPTLGLASSERAVAVLGLVLAAAAWALPARASEPRPAGSGSHRAGVSDIVSGRAATTAMFCAVVLAGMAALGYQVLWTRILVLVVGSSSTAFALMLGVYLAGLALGAYLAGRLRWWEAQPARALQALQLAIGITVLLGASLYGRLPSAALFGFWLLGTAPWSALAVNFLLTAAVILPPTVLIGATFPVVARLMEGDRPRRGREVGLALALTTAGNVAGILLAAFALIPALGLQRGILALAAANLSAALILWLATARRPGPRRYLLPAAALGVVAALATLPSWHVAVMTSGVFRQAPVYLALLGGAGGLDRAVSAYRSRYYREGSEAVVAVFDRPTLRGAPHRTLTLDGKVDASTGADMSTQVLSGHLPLLFRPTAREALVIGLASGVTVGALTRHALQRIDVVEIEPAVVEASREFDRFSGAPLDDPRVSVRIADGRRYLQRIRQDYDIIVSEPSNPWMSMSARLFTREFFERVRARLGRDGVLVQWLPLYGLSRGQLEAELRTLLAVFPELALFRVAEGDLVALASAGPLRLDAAAVTRLLADEGPATLPVLGISSPAELLARWVADAEGLREAIGPGPLNTDDNALLEFGSPWYLLGDTQDENAGLLQRAAGQSGVAARILDAWLAPAGDHGDFLQALARQYREQHRLEALQALASALDARGRNRDAALVLGDLRAAQGRWSGARAAWRRHGGTAGRLRLARAAARTGDAAEAARLYEAIDGDHHLGADDAFSFALVLAQLDRPRAAVQQLPERRVPPRTSTDILAPFARHVLLSRVGAAESAAAALREFRHTLDATRRCLELEAGCERIVDALLTRMHGELPAFRPAERRTLEREVFLRVTRPLPHYFSAVRELWLGQAPAAATSFRRYLNLLPEPDPRSRAHAFLDARTPAPSAMNPDQEASSDVDVPDSADSLARGRTASTAATEPSRREYPTR